MRTVFISAVVSATCATRAPKPRVAKPTILCAAAMYSNTAHGLNTEHIAAYTLRTHAYVKRTCGSRFSSKRQHSPALAASVIPPLYYHKSTAALLIESCTSKLINHSLPMIEAAMFSPVVILRSGLRRLRVHTGCKYVKVTASQCVHIVSAAVGQ
eukprot:8859-Heterococcus_DN1.PRE.1